MAMSAPTPSEARLETQYQGFLAALPALKRDHAGRWIVWFNGFQSAHDDEDEAERWALRHLPYGSDFVLARAADPEVITLSGLAPFRLAL